MEEGEVAMEVEAGPEAVVPPEAGAAVKGDKSMVSPAPDYFEEDHHVEHQDDHHRVETPLPPHSPSGDLILAEEAVRRVVEGYSLLLLGQLHELSRNLFLDVFPDTISRGPSEELVALLPQRGTHTDDGSGEAPDSGDAAEQQGEEVEEVEEEEKDDGDDEHATTTPSPPDSPSGQGFQTFAVLSGAAAVWCEVVDQIVMVESSRIACAMTGGDDAAQTSPDVECAAVGVLGACGMAVIAERLIENRREAEERERVAREFERKKEELQREREELEQQRAEAERANAEALQRLAALEAESASKAREEWEAIDAKRREIEGMADKVDKEREKVVAERSFRVEVMRHEDSCRRMEESAWEALWQERKKFEEERGALEAELTTYRKFHHQSHRDTAEARCKVMLQHEALRARFLEAEVTRLESHVRKMNVANGREARERNVDLPRVVDVPLPQPPASTRLDAMASELRKLEEQEKSLTEELNPTPCGAYTPIPLLDALRWRSSTPQLEPYEPVPEELPLGTSRDHRPEGPTAPPKTHSVGVDEVRKESRRGASDDADLLVKLSKAVGDLKELKCGIQVELQRTLDLARDRPYHPRGGRPVESPHSPLYSFSPPALVQHRAPTYRAASPPRRPAARQRHVSPQRVHEEYEEEVEDLRRGKVRGAVLSQHERDTADRTPCTLGGSPSSIVSTPTTAPSLVSPQRRLSPSKMLSPSRRPDETPPPVHDALRRAREMLDQYRLSPRRTPQCRPLSTPPLPSTSSRRVLYF